MARVKVTDLPPRGQLNQREMGEGSSRFEPPRLGSGLEVGNTLQGSGEDFGHEDSGHRAKEAPGLHCLQYRGG